MKESEQKVITLNGIDEAALSELINFAYCGQVSRDGNIDYVKGQ